MPDHTERKTVNAERGGRLFTVAALLATTVLSGCSQIPDAINPAEWYKSTMEFFSGDRQEAKADDKQSGLAADRGKAPPGSEQSFPNLASVDQQRQAHDDRAGGLVADPNKPKYAPSIALQGEASTTLQSPPPKPPAPTTETAAVQPAPPAVPTMPVTPAAPAPMPAAEPAPSVAAAPPMPAQTPADQRQFQAQLARRLAEIRAQAMQPSALPSAARQPMAAADIGTVVVSSTGVEASAAQLAEAPTQAAAPPTGIARPAPSLAPGSTRVATILFSNGSASLNNRDRRILANVRALLEERGGRLRIVGHASSRTRNVDPVRHKMINFKVSMDRANSVARQLIRMGVESAAISVDAVSDSQPVYYEFMPSGEAGNRRAEIYLES